MNLNGNLTPKQVTSKEQCVYHTVYNLHDNLERKMYTDQTGRFPEKLSCGMQYIMVLFELDNNAILVESMWNCTSGEMVKAYQTLIDH